MTNGMHMSINGVDPAHIEQYLIGVNYPATKEDLIKAAEDNDADDDLVQALDNLPEEEFQTEEELSQALDEMF